MFNRHLQSIPGNHEDSVLVLYQYFSCLPDKVKEKIKLKKNLLLDDLQREAQQVFFMTEAIEEKGRKANMLYTTIQSPRFAKMFSPELKPMARETFIKLLEAQFDKFVEKVTSEQKIREKISPPAPFRVSHQISVLRA